MTDDYNKLLQRQIRKYLQDIEHTPEIKRFLEAVNESYHHAEQDHTLLSRAMEISSRELMEKNRQLHKKNDMLDSFVYRVSHDLKTPANNIISMVKMLKDVLGEAGQSPMVTKILDHLDSAGRSMQVRILDLLEMTRMENQIDEKPILIDLKEEVDKVVEELDNFIETTGARVTTNFGKAEKVLFGRENIVSILRNLIGNGLKYRDLKKTPVVEVASGTNEKGFWLSVSDNGLGIDMEKDGDRLFKMFSRLHDHVEGTGVGLYIVNKIVEYYHGNITVESRINDGTKFKIQFPGEVIPGETQFDFAD